MYTNGTCRGNITYSSDITTPRLSDAYLRYSPPVFLIHGDVPSAIPKETIYILPGGAVYYAKKEYPFYSEVCPAVVVLYNTLRNAPYGMSFTTCFLKSSFLLWYLRTKFESVDMFNPHIMSNIRLPNIEVKEKTFNEKLKQIDKSFQEILKLEKDYLITYKKLNTREEIAELTKEHNSKVDVLAYQIDNIIYEILGLSFYEIACIQDYLRINKIYLPSARQNESTLTKFLNRGLSIPEWNKEE